MFLLVVKQARFIANEIDKAMLPKVGQRIGLKTRTMPARNLIPQNVGQAVRAFRKIAGAVVWIRFINVETKLRSARFAIDSLASQDVPEAPPGFRYADLTR
jgi:hypothetical protein